MGHVAHVGDRRGIYRVLVGILEGKKPLGRPRCRWEDNIKMDLQEVGCGDMEWINVRIMYTFWYLCMTIVAMLPLHF
jgi:hypothetical protein